MALQLEEFFLSKLGSQLLATVGAVVAGGLLLALKEAIDRRRERNKARSRVSTLLKQAAHEIRFNTEKMQVFLAEVKGMQDGLTRGANYFLAPRYTLHPHFVEFLRKELAQHSSVDVSTLNDLGHVYYELAQIAVHMQSVYDDNDVLLTDRLELVAELLETRIVEFTDLAADLQQRSQGSRSARDLKGARPDVPAAAV